VSEPPPEIGLISDTHGLLRTEALAALEGCALILHAGDVGPREILLGLEGIAPVHAVRGNTDVEVPAAGLPLVRQVEWRGLRLELVHILEDLPVDPAARGVHVVVSGHTHKPVIERRNGVLFVNPGSAGPRRFRLPVCLARLTIGRNGPEARIVEIVPAPQRS
jgi:putative phosphoesterase